MNTQKNEIVKKMREEFFHKDKNERPSDKIYGNNSFIETLVGKHKFEKVFKSALIFLSELNRDEISFLERSDYGKPKWILKCLFEKALEKGYEKEISDTVIEMCQKGNENCLFLLDILQNKATEKSVLYLEKIEKEISKIDKRTKFSPQGEVKAKVKKHETKIQNLIKKFRPQELSLFPQSHKTPAKF